MSASAGDAGSTAPRSTDSAALLPPFEQLLRERREAQCLTQTDLARRMNRSPSLVSLLESKKRLPTRPLIGEIARALNLTEDERNRLLLAAGFQADELESAIKQIVALLARQTTLDGTEQALVHADLSNVVSSWRDLFDGLTQLRSGRLVDAREHFDKMAHHSEYSPTLKAALLIRRADVLVEVGKLRQAKMVLLKAGRIMQHWPEGWGLALRAERAASLAMLELRKGQYASARRSLDESVQWYRQLLHSATPERGDEAQVSASWGLGKSHKRLAQVALFQDDVEESLRYTRIARDHFGRVPASPIRAIWLRRTMELEAWAYSKRGDFERARRLHRDALDESRAARDAYGEARGYLYLGDDIRRALTRCFDAALSSQPFTPAQRRKAIASALERELGGKGRVAELLDEAEGHYADALDHSNALGQRILLGRALLGRGVILRLKATVLDAPAHYADALDALEQAQDLERQIGQGRRLPSIYVALAEVAWEEGAHGWVQRALAAYQDACDILNAPGIRSQDAASANQREAVRQALDALEAVAASLATQPVSVSPIAKWGHVIEPGASRAWRETCAEVIEIIHQAIRESDLEPYALLESALAWQKKLAEVEATGGPHLLAQNRLSAALMRHAYQETSAQAEAAARVRHEALERSVQAERWVSYDLCCRPVVESGLYRANPNVMTQIREAARLVRAYPHGYCLVAGRYELPLAFEVKGQHVLVQAPPQLACLFPHGQVAAPTTETQVCYHITSAGVAVQLTDIFHRLVDTAKESIHLEESTEEWLERHAWAYERGAKHAAPAL